MLAKRINCSLFSFVILVLFSTTKISAVETTTDSLLDLSIEQLMNIEVVTASKHSEPLRKAPAIISTIDADQIKNFGARNLLDILDKMPGVYPFSSFIFPQNTLAIRGDLPSHSSPHFLILIDGRPFRETSLGGQNVNILTAFPISAIERIELIRGPGSVLYGTNAFSGVINIITRKNIGNSFLAKAGVGSFDTKNVDLSASLAKGKLSINTDLHVLQEEGWPLEAILNPPNQSSLLFGEKHLSSHLKLEYESLSINAYLGSVEYDHFQPGNPINPDPVASRSESNRVFLDFGHKKWVSPFVRIESNFTYNHMHSHLQDAILKEISLHMNDYILESTIYYKLNKKIDFLFGGLLHRVTGERTSPSSVQVPAYEENWYSVYMQGDYRLNSYLKFNAGGQFNKIPDVDAEFVPRLGLILSPAKRWDIKLLYAEAFRSPVASETELQLPPIIKGNSLLTPEKVRTIDLQMMYSAEKGYFAATYYNSQQQDLITRTASTDADFISEFVNLGKVTYSGVELEGQFSTNTGISFMGSMSYQKTKDTESSVTVVPNWMVKTGVAYEFNKGIQLGIFNSYVDGASIKPGANEVNPAPSAFNWLTANLRLNLSSVLEDKDVAPFILNVYAINLLGETVYYPVTDLSSVNSIPGRSGRAIMASFEVAY